MMARFLLALMLLAVPRAFGQALPELGDVAEASLSSLQERRLGESIMREIRADRDYYDEPEVTAYVNRIGQRLASHTDTRQDFEFFLIRDPSINAFALPGGYVGLHTGLLLTAQSESELASVMGHEISHVTQRHIARMFAQQKQSQVLSIASMAAAILLSRVSGEAASAAAAFGQAAAIQSQLNFTRDNEREADRFGLQLMEAAGFDPRGMASFFERLQRATRVYETAAPSYLRTHPLTYERIADIENRVQEFPYRQIPDSADFQLARAKLRAELETPRDAVAFFESSLKERKFLSEGATRYGLAVSALRVNDPRRAREELAAAAKLVPANAMIDTLGCKVTRASGPLEPALACYADAIRSYPGYRPLVYDYADTLLQGRRPEAALKLVEGQLQVITSDYRLYLLQARGYAALGRPLAQHRAQAEAYVRQGNVHAAVEQLQIGLKSGDGDFYQLSSAEARLRELRRLDEEIRKESRK